MARRKKAAVTEEVPEVTAALPPIEPDAGGEDLPVEFGDGGGTLEVDEDSEVKGVVESFDYSGIAADILKSALGNIAHTIHPLPECVDGEAASKVIADLVAAGLVHDKAEPNLTAAGVEAARKL